jgi:hypothetical protein
MRKGVCCQSKLCCDSDTLAIIFTRMPEKPLVFISCGQATDAEKRLGISIAGLVHELTPFQPFFAEQESTLSGLVTNILGSLDRAVGFIAVMHPRGVVTTPTRTHVRASVWVEQEIAIAAHLVHVQKKKLNVQAYAHTDIQLEGIREQLHLNPVRFDHDEEILAHLRSKLPDWIPYDSSVLQLRAVPGFVRQREGGIVELQLRGLLKNFGKAMVSEYHVDVLMPKPLLQGDNATYYHEVRDRATDSHRFFRFPARDAKPPAIYQDDEEQLFALPMYLDRNRLLNPDLLTSSVKLTCYAGDVRVSVSRPVSELLFGEADIERFLSKIKA